MPASGATLQELAAPLNRGDFSVVVQALERLPSSARNVIAILGAGQFLRVFENG